MRRRWTGQPLRADSIPSFGINLAQWATRVCRAPTTSPSSRCSLFSSNREEAIDALCLNQERPGSKVETYKDFFRMYTIILLVALQSESRPSNTLIPFPAWENIKLGLQFTKPTHYSYVIKYFNILLRVNNLLCSTIITSSIFILAAICSL